MILASMFFLFSCTHHDESPVAQSSQRSLADELAGDAGEGFERAYVPREFRFPADHGPHPGFKHEWWYFTGNLDTAEGRHFGYQLTFFRIALSAEPLSGESAWRSNQIYMGHFALSDVAARRYHSFERFSRDAVGLAGAEASPFRVWLDDWHVNGEAVNAVCDGCLAMNIKAGEDDVTLDLRLSGSKPVVLQGDRGLSQKSTEPGNASYYYSLTRLSTEGTVTVEGERYPVRGSSWMDREWSTSALGADQVGWDWFSLQLSDGRELMFYRLRRKDGSADPLSAGVLVADDGSTQALTLSDVKVTAVDVWQSPKTGRRYPAAWVIDVPGLGLNLSVKPWMADQEFHHTMTYWEGAVGVQGTAEGRPISGVGYVELAGYEREG